MRVKVVLRARQRAFLPFDNKRELQALIYKLIAAASEEYAEFLHAQGLRLVSGKKFKLFVFSDFKIFPFVMDKNRGGFKNIEKLELVFSTALPKSFESFILGIFKEQEISLGFAGLGKYFFTIESVETLPEIDLGDGFSFRCLSPIVTSTMEERNGKLTTHYVEYDTKEEKTKFAENVHKNLLNKFQAFYGREFEKQGYEFDFGFDEKYVCQKNGKIYKLVKYKDIRIKGVLAPGWIKAPKELLELGYYGGIGEGNPMGFGCVEIVKERS